MNHHITIRDETAADIDAITNVTIAAFATLDLSSHTEQFIVRALRAADALSVSLVAERSGAIVGHIAFSPVTVSDGTTDWYGLGPVSVLPEHQRQGIGKALVNDGLSRLEKLSAKGCCLVGHPEYYGRLGFENPTDLGVDGVPHNAFFIQRLAGETPRGHVVFHDAFSATS